MSRPGTTVIQRDTPPPRSAPTDTGIWFVAGLADRGPAAPVLITSLAQFVESFGARVSYSVLYDALEAYFRDGGARAYVSRVVGPAAAPATVTINDSGGAATLVVTAKSDGAWGNTLNVAVLAGDGAGEFKIQISDDALGILETSPSLADKTAAFAWAAGSDFVTLTDAASANDPNVVAATSLAGGTDDRANITDAQWLAALNVFTRDLGPGQVSAPGRTSDVGHQQVLDHAAANGRVALLDAPDVTDKATLIASANALRSLANARFGGLFGPWAIVPGLTIGTTRSVPYSAIQAGLCARLDGLGETPNVAAAGENGQSLFALDVKASFTDADRQELNDAGVNLAVLKFGGVRTYGYRTLVNPATDPNHVELSHARLGMAITAKGDAIAERFVFAEIDGRRHKINEFGGQLVGMLSPYFDAGALYGATPDEAFNVDVGDQVNTPSTIANRELHAIIVVKMSPSAEEVILEIVKVATQEAVA